MGTASSKSSPGRHDSFSEVVGCDDNLCDKSDKPSRGHKMTRVMVIATLVVGVLAFGKCERSPRPVRSTQGAGILEGVVVAPDGNPVPHALVAVTREVVELTELGTRPVAQT